MRIEASSLQGNHFASSSLLKPRRVHKSCDDMSQCTSTGSADASISRRVECKGTCNQGNFLESATRTQKTAYFSLVKLDLSIFQWLLPKKELKNISRQIRKLGKKQGSSFWPEGSRRTNALRTILGVFQFDSWQGIP